MIDILNFLNERKINYSENEDLRRRSTFRIGKNCHLAVFPSTVDELISVVRYLRNRNKKYIVLGKGSNVLFPDYDIEYPIIFTEKLGGLCLDSDNGNLLICESGVSLAKAVNIAAEKNLGGLEFASGIPGSVGGAVVMNAGAYGKNINDVLLWSDFINKDGEIKKISNKEHNFGYRKSVFASDDIVLRSCLCFENKPSDEIKKEISMLALKRRNSQPLEYPSAGSVFKRPEGYYVGAMIDDCGLKGFSVGDAQISCKHSGFIINRGNASSDNVRELVEIIREKVFEKFGVKLEREIRYID